MQNPIHPDVLILADLLRAEWPAARERIRLSGHPTCDGDADGESGDADAEAAKAAAAAAAKAAEDDDSDADDDKVTKDDDWQVKSRKNEARAKKAESKAAQVAKERDDLAKKLAKIEASNLTDQEKAIKAARAEAEATVTSKYEAERRSDRIEGAVTKLALTGFKVKDGDKEITLKFADPDDAQLRLDRALRNEEITYDEIYADGKVQTDALTAFLTELLEEHPRLRAEPGATQKVVDMDAGKGSGSGRKSLEDMSPDDHLKEIQSR
jgi:hypothetical protein